MFSMEGFSKSYTDEDFLKEQGVPLEAPETQTHSEVTKLGQRVRFEGIRTYHLRYPVPTMLPILLDLESALYSHSEKIKLPAKGFCLGIFGSGL